ncbi:hypothetical protein WKH31_11355 [Metabacillus indicus]|uniref:hypothetical protein n=1 Tax=Metabacillus indicus TaxID=246786 RepID=UPI0031768DFC
MDSEREQYMRVGGTENPNNWDAAKESLLISSILEESRKGRTLKAITEDVSKEIGISASACQSYWYNNVSKHYLEEFKQIKLDQEENWSNEDMQLLDHLISVEYAHLKPYEVLPIASEIMKRHIDVIRKKLFALQRQKRLQSD